LISEQKNCLHLYGNRELGNVNLYATSGGDLAFGNKKDNNDQVLYRKFNFDHSLTLYHSFFTHFPSFNVYNIEVNTSGGFSFIKY